MAEGQGRSSGQGLKLLHLRDFFYRYADRDHPQNIKRDIIPYLAAKGITASLKTIYTDIEALRDVLGMPIQYDGSKRGYYITKPLFDGAELAMLVNLIDQASFLTGDDAKQLMRKVVDLGTIYDRPMLIERLKDYEHKMPTDNSVIENLRLLDQAIRQKRQITFQKIYYVADHSNHTETDSEVIIASPLSIKIIDGRHILRYAVDDEYNTDEAIMMKKAMQMMLFDGDDGDGFTYYEQDISLMANIRIISPPTEYGKDVYKTYDRPDVQRAVTIRFRNEVLNRVSGELGKDAILIPVDLDHFKVTIHRELNNIFYRWLAGYGGFARIDSPQEAVDGLLNWYRRGLLEQEILYRYGVEPSSVISEEELYALPSKESSLALAAPHGSWNIDFTDVVRDKSGIEVDFHLPDYMDPQDA